eukprot:gene29970-37412_t
MQNFSASLRHPAAPLSQGTEGDAGHFVLPVHYKKGKEECGATTPTQLRQKRKARGHVLPHHCGEVELLQLVASEPASARGKAKLLDSTILHGEQSEYMDLGEAEMCLVAVPNTTLLAASNPKKQRAVQSLLPASEHALVAFSQPKPPEGGLSSNMNIHMMVAASGGTEWTEWMRSDLPCLRCHFQ